MEASNNKCGHTRWLLLATLSTLIFSACNQNTQQQKNVDELQNYVRNHTDSIDQYADRDWDSLDNEFTLKQAAINDTARLNEAMRQSYYNSLNVWNTFKTNYTIKRKAKSELAQMDSLRKSLTLDGIRTDYADLTATDLLAEYQHFVNTVSSNKDNYTKPQWTVINVTWKALKGRNREIEKDVSARDGAKILKLQLEYTAIKAVNRPIADNS
jgi:hypothetical protein